MVVYKLIGAGRELIESDVRAPAGIQLTGTVRLLAGVAVPQFQMLLESSTIQEESAAKSAARSS